MALGNWNDFIAFQMQQDSQSLAGSLIMKDCMFSSPEKLCVSFLLFISKQLGSLMHETNMWTEIKRKNLFQKLGSISLTIMHHVIAKSG